MTLFQIFHLAILGTVFYLIIMVISIIQMKPDYFIRSKSKRKSKRKHYLLWLLSKVVKNVIGVALILVGTLMLILPGQGLLTILMGLFFLDFPGKRKIELYIIRQPTVYKSINWIRRKANRPPIII